MENVASFVHRQVPVSRETGLVRFARLPGPISLLENLDLLFRSHVAAGLGYNPRRLIQSLGNTL